MKPQKMGKQSMVEEHLMSRMSIAERKQRIRELWKEGIIEYGEMKKLIKQVEEEYTE